MFEAEYEICSFSSPYIAAWATSSMGTLLPDGAVILPSAQTSPPASSSIITEA
jgi:hypothetical protein